MLELRIRKRIFTMFILFGICFLVLSIYLAILMIFRSDYYMKKADALHNRERSIKASRGLIYDRNGIVLAGNKKVCSISVIHAQIQNEQKVIDALNQYIDVDYKTLCKKVKANTMRELIASNVEKEIADQIRELNISGIIIDEDDKRTYPYGDLASKVIGFTGSDNQGVVGIETQYDSLLAGVPGSILTPTDAHGYEIVNEAQSRIDPVSGNNLYVSIDLNIQKYAQQAAEKIMKEKDAKRVAIILMNPNNGEIYAMVDCPEYDLNKPFCVDVNHNKISTNTDELNEMWRCFCINDTYEPGSTFKTITATAALDYGIVSVNDTFFCPGYKMVGDRRIRCAKTTGHGSQNFKEGLMNSCNPVFIEVGTRVGVKNMYKMFHQLGLMEMTGIDLPGEASSIMHQQKNVGEVELATISFGQSFQITPLQLLRGISAVINGGNLITPHFAMYATDTEGNRIKEYQYTKEKGVIKNETSLKMRELLEAVVSEGSGSNGSVKGYRIGGKTATSEKLPRGTGKYISSFMGFAPANNPQVIGICLIDEPKGTYYGGMIAAPVIAEVYENILPYLGISEVYDENDVDHAVESMEIID